MDGESAGRERAEDPCYGPIFPVTDHSTLPPPYSRPGLGAEGRELRCWFFGPTPPCLARWLGMFWAGPAHRSARKVGPRVSARRVLCATGLSDSQGPERVRDSRAGGTRGPGGGPASTRTTARTTTRTAAAGVGRSTHPRRAGGGGVKVGRRCAGPLRDRGGRRRAITSPTARSPLRLPKCVQGPVRRSPSLVRPYGALSTLRAPTPFSAPPPNRSRILSPYRPCPEVSSHLIFYLCIY